MANNIEEFESTDLVTMANVNERINATNVALQALSQTVASGVKIATGSYTGTDTYGANNPNTLVFDFEPKIVFVISTDGGNYMSSIKGNTRFYYNNVLSSDGHNQIEWGENSVSWYTDGTASISAKPGKQLNASSATYNYIAIG